MSEVLITLGIIGIVAALVMPGIVDKYQERVLLRQLDVAYSMLSQATEKMMNDEGVDIRDFGSTNQERVRKYFSLLPKYLTVVNPDNISKINHSNYKVLNPATGKFFNASNVPNPGWPRLALANGMYIFANSIGSSGVNDCSLYKNFTYTPGFSPGGGGGTYGYACSNEIMVDINGAKGPNAVSKDLFPFFLVRDGIIPAGMPKENIWCQSFNDSCGMNAGRSIDTFKCTAWALYNKNMDYLRCKGLKWNGKNKCS